ncbi:MAG: EAL domain-containing protein [Terracidiphilus sp.]|jgi:EAL domain-containing protein (putative c-di-GMP-specific phosphodiesterase class I)
MSTVTKKLFSKGEALIREGERGECAYIIESGNVEILVQRAGQLIQIGTRGAGSLLGEMAMIDDKPRTATVRALDDCTVLEITREDFAHRVESADPVLKMVMRVITARYRDMMARTDTIRVLPSTPAVEASEKSDTSHDTAVTAIRLNSELKRALEQNELLLFYQPIIDIQKMRIAGFEALMRWAHPVNGMISPGIFIPVAEESGLINEMSRLALDLACDAAIKLQAAASPDLIVDEPLFVGVNFSVKDFAAAELFNNLKATIEEKKINPLQIHLEITETLLMESPEAARAELERCREIGINISIDDFGSGYSSLSYLHYFPIDTLKIDQSFIRSLSTHPGSLVLVKAIIGLAQNLGMKVIAEGVESAEDARRLQVMGCEYIQGYFFSKPLPFDKAISFVQSWQAPSLEAVAQG